MNLEEIRRERDAAPYGAKDEVIQRYAVMYGVSSQTIYRKLASAFGKSRKRVSEVTIPDEYIDEIAKIKAKRFKDRELCTEDAIMIAERAGRVPKGLLCVSTVDRRLRENGFRDKKPVSRILEDFSNLVHYVDFSRSEYISIQTFDESKGEYLLKFNGKSLRYKNKAGKAFSLWLAGLRDGASGVRHVRYYTVTGENAYMGLDFLAWCWNRERDDHPLNSIPHYIRMDNGSMSVNEDLLNFYEALQVELRKSKPYNKNAMGKIERPWRTFWQRFELPLLKEKGDGFSLYMSELNELAFDYTLKEMEKPHTFYRNISRKDVYLKDMLAYPPRVYDGDFQRLAARTKRCKVGADLIFWFKGEAYTAPDRYLGKWVLVWQNVKGEIIGEGEHDGERFPVVVFDPQAWDDFKSYPDTYRERMEKLETNGNIIRLPAKKPEKIVAKSVFTETQKLVFTADQAKQYIAQELNLHSYAQVAHIFDDLLIERTDKEAIDHVINILKKEVI